jgi:hypothetical protein
VALGVERRVEVEVRRPEAASSKPASSAPETLSAVRSEWLPRLTRPKPLRDAFELGREKRALRTLESRFIHPQWDVGLNREVEKKLSRYHDVHSAGAPIVSRRPALELLLERSFDAGEDPELREELIQKLGYVGDSRSLPLLGRILSNGTSKERTLARGALEQLHRDSKAKTGARLRAENPVFWRWYEKTLAWQRRVSDVLVRRVLEGGTTSLERQLREHTLIGADGTPVLLDEGWMTGPREARARLPDVYNRNTIERLEQLRAQGNPFASPAFWRAADRVLADARAKNRYFVDATGAATREIDAFVARGPNARLHPPSHLPDRMPGVEARFELSQFEKGLAQHAEGMKDETVAEAWRDFELQDPNELDAFVHWSATVQPFARTAREDRLLGRALRASRIKLQERTPEGEIRRNPTARRVELGMEGPRAPAGEKEIWLYVIDERGAPWIAQEKDTLGHPTLMRAADGSPLLAGRVGGEVTFDERGHIVELNNYSWRYGRYPDRTGDKLRNAALRFRELGIPVDKAVWYDLHIDPAHRPPGDVVFSAPLLPSEEKPSTTSG